MKKLLCFLVVCLTITQVFSQTDTLQIGDTAPEIRFASPHGDTISLSSQRGKVVLVDFWATWCSPCVKEQSELVKLYKTYKKVEFSAGKGFEIYGVSLDTKKESWEAVIEKKKINWIQVSDLLFWSSPVTKAYNIQALPFNLLIDDTGKVIAINIHGEELEQTLENLRINN